MGRTIYKNVTISEIRENIDNFPWEELFFYEPKVDVDMDFYREFKDKIDWDAITDYFYFNDKDFIKEFLDYLPDIYRENYEDQLK